MYAFSSDKVYAFHFIAIWRARACALYACLWIVCRYKIGEYRGTEPRSEYGRYFGMSFIASPVVVQVDYLLLRRSASIRAYTQSTIRFQSNHVHMRLLCRSWKTPCYCTRACSAIRSTRSKTKIFSPKVRDVKMEPSSDGVLGSARTRSMFLKYINSA